MIQKNHFWIGAKGGLLDKKHYLAMREAVWLFLYLVLRQTGVNADGEGVILYGKALSRSYIARDIGLPEWKIKSWTARLVKHAYIRTVRSGNAGMIFFVRKAKDKSKKYRNGRVTGHAQVGTDSHRPSSQVGMESYQRSVRNRADLEPHQLSNQPDARFTTILSSKDLSYYNNTAAAKAAAEPLRFMKTLARQKTMPRDMSPAELDERRRFLLKQAERLQARP